jgi:hypothetical protein
MTVTCISTERVSLENDGAYVAGRLEAGRELRREDLPTATFGDLERQEILLAKAADRSLLGRMNDMAFRCEHAIAGAGGLARTDLAELNRALRRNINSARGYRPPIELAHLQGGRSAAGTGTITDPATWDPIRRVWNCAS